MTKYERLIQLDASEAVAEHGSLDAAIAALETLIANFKREDTTESPIAMRKFYRCVLAQLRTDRANNR